MIVQAVDGRRHDLRAAEWGTGHLIPSWSADMVTSSGVVVTDRDAVDLSTVAAAIRQPAVLAAGLPLDVYDVSQDRRVRTLSRGKWQNRLLDRPDPAISGHQFWSDLFSHIDGFGNAYAYKYRDGGRVVEMWLLDPERVTVEVDTRTRERTYMCVRENGDRVLVPAGDILHIRGWDNTGAPQARSPAARHRDNLGKIKARGRFEERFMRNDARPGVVLKFPREVTRDQAREFLDLWNERHMGTGNTGKAAVIGGGGEIQTIPVSFRDAQFIEGEKFSVHDVARIYDWPAELLGEDQTVRPFVELMAKAVRLHLMPRLQRVEGAFGDDPDLFGPGSKFRPYFDVSELLRGDAATMADVYHKLTQVGIMTPNESRIPLGLPPLPEGDNLQQTPVGGAPNRPAAADGGQPPDVDADDGEERSRRRPPAPEAVLERTVTREVLGSPKPPVVNVTVEPTPVTVNVAPTPVTVEPTPVTVNVEPTPVTVTQPETVVHNHNTIQMPAPGKKKITYHRNPMTGQPEGATVEEE